MAEEKDKAVTYTADQVEQMKADTLKEANANHEAWVQKLINEWKLKDKVLSAVWTVAWDNTALIGIFDEDPAVGKEILDKYYNGQTIEQYKESIWYEVSQEQATDELIEKKANSIYESNKIKDVKKDFIEKLGLEWEELDSFNEEFSGRMQMKNFSVDNLDDNLIKAFKLATGYSDEQVRKLNNTKVVAKSTKVSWKDNTWKTEKTKVADEVNSFLDTYG